jgi:large subunit ribosomal protein L7A
MIKVHSTIEGPRVVGTKQTLKALNDGEVTLLFVARDAKPDVVGEVLRFAELNGINVNYVDSMEFLGKACNINVKTATAALIKKENGGEN